MSVTEDIQKAVDENGGSLTSAERATIIEVSATVDEAVNRCKARLEGREAESEDEPEPAPAKRSHKKKPS